MKGYLPVNAYSAVQLGAACSLIREEKDSGIVAA
jgi:hypothetical protein